MSTTPLPSAGGGPGSGGSSPVRTAARFRADDPRGALRDDLATVPAEGIEPCQVVVATCSGSTDPLVARVRGSAQNLLAREPDVPARVTAGQSSAGHIQGVVDLAPQ
ncbi:hypothetical protein GCM10010121_066990 [Streptomyces brasiliensis]|uniref:Uncharacterized protein n=1 Tax=Streptomyces brasiliensis TaxID=1954 RepID=A0A917L7E8_9ACTN|nr:hypothetical protein GCM10010121_066990 [Streptomyces brasiliensis]